MTHTRNQNQHNEIDEQKMFYNNHLNQIKIFNLLVAI